MYQENITVTLLALCKIFIGLNYNGKRDNNETQHSGYIAPLLLTKWNLLSWETSAA